MLTQTLSPPRHLYVSEENRNLLEILQRRNLNLGRINAVSQKLTTILDTDEVLGYLVKASAEIIGAPVASVWLWEDDEQREILTCRATFPTHEIEAIRHLRLPRDQGVAGWVVSHGMSAVTEDAYRDERFVSEIDKSTGFKTQSMLAVPLLIRDEVIGVIEILNKTQTDFDDEDLTMVETLANSAAIALENANLVASLQAQNSELDAFAHTVAHDLKGPLSMILGFADMLEDGTDFMSPAEISQTCSTIARNAIKMDSIIKEILLLSGVRKKDVEFRPIAMGDVVQEALNRITHLTAQSDATFTVPRQWPMAMGHAPWVEEIWANYLSNAVKYGGTPPVVELGYEEVDDVVWFWVRDNGKGLSAEEKEKLFIPFTRLEQVRAKGHGLGLSIVHRIVNKLGGETAIESELGKGSTFKFCLPRTK